MRYDKSVYLAFRKNALSHSFAAHDIYNAKLGERTVAHVYFVNASDDEGLYHPHMVIVSHDGSGGPNSLINVARPPGDGTAGTMYQDQTITRRAILENIFIQPKSSTLATGAIAILSVLAGDATSYQWYIGTSGDDSNPITGANSNITSANPSETTSYWVRVFGTEGFATDSDTATITIPVASGYEAWSSTNITAGLDATRTGDPDGDNLPNLLEFALGLDPLTADAEPLTITQTTATYTRPQGGAEGVTYTLQFSTDLSTWSTVDQSSVSPALPDTEIVQHLLGAATKGFVRILVVD